MFRRSREESQCRGPRQPGVRSVILPNIIDNLPSGSTITLTKTVSRVNTRFSDTKNYLTAAISPASIPIKIFHCSIMRVYDKGGGLCLHFNFFLYYSVRQLAVMLAAAIAVPVSFADDTANKLNAVLSGPRNNTSDHRKHNHFNRSSSSASRQQAGLYMFLNT